MFTPYALSSLLLTIAGLVIADWRKRSAGISVAFFAFGVGYEGWARCGGRGSEGPVFLFLTAAFLFFLCWIPWRILYRGTALKRLDALVLVLNGTFYFSASYNLLEKNYHAWLGLFAVALAGAYLVVAYL